MKIQILTLFPEMFESALSHSIIGRAIQKDLVDIQIHNLRDWGHGARKTVDDRPYGGGVGMVLMVEPIYNALRDIKNTGSKVILLTPQGARFSQERAKKLSQENDLILICGRYEGFDERIRNLADEEISIGDYVLTGGELPAMVVVDAVARLIPGVLAKEEATKFESFTENLLEYPQYTRPEDFRGSKVPEILLTGDHKKIDEWRREKSLEKTKKVRPDLIK